ncbi:SWIM zinc finger family protein [Microtetraspora malaysiensis]|uniref:SWIM zinc finger family protein n=1 Tax=Microtetraspora malaysiensis TaxID=161358 RepID=UPI003D90CDCC
MTGFTKDDLRTLAGGKSYDRGVDYVDAVDDLQVDSGKIFAIVYGTEPYEVELTVGRRGLDGVCDCPWGQEGNFCKHCVAVGLVYLSRREHGEAVPDRFDLRSYLTPLDSQELVALLMELAEGDRNIRRRLEARAVTDPVTDAQDLRERIDRMLRVHRHVDWDDSWDYADTIGGIADELEQLSIP